MEIHGPFRGKAFQNDLSVTRQMVKSDEAQGTKTPHISGKGATEGTSQTTSLSRLTEGLRQVSEVREEVVSRVRDNLNSGEYLSKEAAQATAAAILKGS